MSSSKKITKQITVFAALVIHDGKILMVKRHEPECPEAHLKWEFPGGKAEFGELPERAIEREILEETGITVKAKRLLPIVYSSMWDYAWGKQHVLMFAFECDYVSEQEAMKDHHVAEIEWVKIEEVLNRQVLPDTEPFLKELFALQENPGLQGLG